MSASLTESERDYVLARLDRDHIAELAEQVAVALATGSSIEACYMPGDGTYYALLFAPLNGDVAGAPGGGTNGQPPSRWWRGDLFVAHGQAGTHADFPRGHDPKFVALQLTDSPASQLAIAELIRAVQERLE